jgi:hypothetical protein
MPMSKKSYVRNQEVDLLLKLSAAGIRLPEPKRRVVREMGKAQELALTEGVEVEEDPELAEIKERHLWLYEVPRSRDTKKPFEGTAYFEKIPKAWIREWEGKEITRDDYIQTDIMDPDAAFRAFIDSANPHFDQLAPYLGFYLYCEQARRWEAEDQRLSDIPEPDRYHWKVREMQRMDDNKLYGINKYVTIKEDGRNGGRRKYRASAPQALLCYLTDVNACFPLAKGRQAAISSTMLAIAAIKAIVTQSFTGIFMVSKKDVTGRKLFKDKFGSTLQHVDPWIRSAWSEDNWSADRIVLGFEKAAKKGDKGMDASEFMLLASEDSMVANGLTPTWSMFDEAQDISTAEQIVAQLDPTLYRFNDRKGGMDRFGQIFLWGTGSSSATGNGAFEAMIRRLSNDWTTGKPTDGWVPLFFDWSCRPGVTFEFYKRMRRKYLEGQTEESKGMTPTERLAIFKAHYPRTLDDCFMSTNRTIIPMEMVLEQKRHIEVEWVRRGLGPQPGRFEPIFNTQIELPAGSYYAHPIVGSRWKPLPADADEHEAPILMFSDAKKRYAHRYFQGTDPIENDGGFSKFASVIIDAVGVDDEYDNEGNQLFFPMPVCVLNARTQFTDELFLQNILMGMYYANEGQKACMELVEINAGKRYVDYKRGAGIELTTALLPRGALLPQYKGGQHTWGLDLKGGKDSRKSSVYHDLTSFLREGYKRIFFPDIFAQIQNTAVTPKPDGSVVWGTRNKNAYNDDLLYALAYADICMRSVNKQPEKIDPTAPKFTTKRYIHRDPVTLMPEYRYERTPVTYA